MTQRRCCIGCHEKPGSYFWRFANTTIDFGGSGHLNALCAAIDKVGDRRGVHPFDDFIIYRND